MNSVWGKTPALLPKNIISHILVEFLPFIFNKNAITNTGYECLHNESCESVTSSGQWKLKYNPQHIHSRRWALDKWDVVCAFTWDCLFLFLLALSSCFDYPGWVDSVNKGVWHCYFFTCLKWMGTHIWRDFRFVLWLVPCGCLSVKYVGQIFVRLFPTFWIGNIPYILCGEQQEDGVLCLSQWFIWLGCKPFCDS